MNLRRRFTFSLLGLALPLFWQAPAQAQATWQPDYFHAVPELRDSRWLLERVEHGPFEERERRAQWEVDRALEDVERAAHVGGDFVYARPPENMYPSPGRLRRVSELLRHARERIGMQRDFVAPELQGRAIGHIDAAIRLTEEVMLERERVRDPYYDRR